MRDGGDGSASVSLSEVEFDVVEAMKLRTASDPASDSITGADLVRGWCRVRINNRRWSDVQHQQKS